MKTALSFFLFLNLFHAAYAQDSVKVKTRVPNFFGINPSITVEEYYEKGEFDINVIPFVYQRPVSKRLDLRFNTILNVGVRNSGGEVNYFGMETALPVFIRKKESITEMSQKIYIAPVFTVARNRVNEHTNFGFYIEPGYNVLFKNRWALSFGPQVGATFFNYDHTENEWSSHIGVKVIFGRWFL